MAIIVECPNEIRQVRLHPSVFIAGGITGCGEWQFDLIDQIKDIENLIVYNPRRRNFPIDDPSAAKQQIVWEYDKLMLSDIIVMHFPKATLCPICLYELGKWINSSAAKNAIVTIEHGYARTNDVIIQTSLARPDVKVFVGSQEECVETMRRYIGHV
jgi:hypothetical protein